MNRKTALTTIKAEYAKHGKPTATAVRAYAESQISYATYTKAAWAGMELYFKENPTS